jgi:hypothetical protein
MTDLGDAPDGFPQAVTGCPISTAVYDDIAAHFSIRAPI